MFFARLVFLLSLLFLLTACVAQLPAQQPTLAAAALPEAANPSIPTATRLPAEPPSPTITPTPTVTPSPAPTPLPSAEPLTLIGDPRSAALTEPEPSGRYPCGAVDLFDFPIEPPDALNVPRSGGDFGRFRARYDKFHAGEDWSGSSRERSLGTPVYAIGHGLVTYAEPLGWGRDVGVVIVQHTFEDGRTVLSFYGHLDPDSVRLWAGTCVARGEQVGNIGQPRTPPHLHFEIRSQQPYAPLGGYWPEDPRLGGWLPPSQTVWQTRVAATPGVVWTRPFAGEATQFVGQLADGQLVLLENRELRLLDPADGSDRPFLALEDGIDSAMVSASTETLTLVTRAGEIVAYNLSDLTPLWQTEPDERGFPTLLPLDDGVLVVYRERLLALDAAGQERWSFDTGSRPFDWLQTEEALYLAWSGSDSAVVRIAPGGEPQPIALQGGHLAAAAGGLWIYGNGGVYRWNGETVSQTVLLPGALPDLGDALALPDGGLLVAYPRASDGRLLQLDAAGNLVWQGGLPESAIGKGRLLSVGERLFWGVLVRDGGSAVAVNLFELDRANQTLHFRFKAGSREPISLDTWLAVVENQLLINLGGGLLAAFAPDGIADLVTQSEGLEGAQ